MNMDINNWNKDWSVFLRYTEFLSLPNKSFAATVLHCCSFGKWASESHWPLLSPGQASQVEEKKGISKVPTQRRIYMTIVFRVEYIHNKYRNTWG
jgi:hypothetical protein